jgi:hypothetical protein
MLVVKIELHSAITGKVSTIAEMIIANTGGTKQRGDYRAWVLKKAPKGWGVGSLWRPRMEKASRHGEVKNYPRLSYNVWRLVIRALKSAFPEER